jgi:hypothetical protein
MCFSGPTTIVIEKLKEQFRDELFVSIDEIIENTP